MWSSVLGIDTSAVIGFVERQDPSVVDTLVAQVVPATRMTFVEAELRHGVAADATDASDRQRTLDTYRRLAAQPESAVQRDVVVEFYAQISGYASRTGNRSGQNDRWILAEGVALGATIFVTQDERQADLMRTWSESTGRDITTHLC